MIKTKNIQVIELADWDNLVKQTYGKPYSLQQQDGCMPRCRIPITVPPVVPIDTENLNRRLPLVVNGLVQTVDFNVWLETDPADHQEQAGWKDYELRLFWYRNFYPPLEQLIQDLYDKGLLPEGEYEIDIDW